MNSAPLAVLLIFGYAGWLIVTMALVFFIALYCDVALTNRFNDAPTRYRISRRGVIFLSALAAVIVIALSAVGLYWIGSMR